MWMLSAYVGHLDIKQVNLENPVSSYIEEVHDITPDLLDMTQLKTGPMISRPNPESVAHNDERSWLICDIVGDWRSGPWGSIGSIGNTTLNTLLGLLTVRTSFILGRVGIIAFTILLGRNTDFGWFALAYFLLGGFRVLWRLVIGPIRPFLDVSQIKLAYGLAETVGLSTVLILPLLAGYLHSRDPFLIYSTGLALIGIFLVISLTLIPRCNRLELDPAIPVHDL